MSLNTLICWIWNTDRELALKTFSTWQLAHLKLFWTWSDQKFVNVIQEWEVDQLQWRPHYILQLDFLCNLLRLSWSTFNDVTVHTYSTKADQLLDLVDQPKWRCAITPWCIQVLCVIYLMHDSKRYVMKDAKSCYESFKKNPPLNPVSCFEYTYKWWRGNCKNSPLPTIGSAFQCVKVDLPFYINVCTCAYVLKWYLALFFFFLLRKVNIPTFAHWNYCSALPMVEPPRCSERYTNCLSIIYMYTQRFTDEKICKVTEKFNR